MLSEVFESAPDGRNPASLTLNLFDDVELAIVLEHGRPTFSGGRAIAGRVVGDPLGTMTFVRNGDSVAGVVRAGGATYHIRSVGAAYAVVVEPDTAKLPGRCGVSGLPPEHRNFLSPASRTPAPGAIPSTAKQSTGDISTDRDALVALYNATHGEEWRFATNWLSEAPLSDWYGVVTDDDGRVVELGLPLNNLRGPIPSEMGDLTELQSLNLIFNGLTGEIPTTLGNLDKVRLLDLQWNQLSGPSRASWATCPVWTV